MNADLAPITGLRTTGLRDPETGEQLIAVEVLLGEAAADGLRLGMQVVMMAVVLVPEGDDDGAAG